MKRGAVIPGSAWALVTGAGSGIGRCFALRLAALGYRVALAGDREAPLQSVRAEIEAARNVPAGPDRHTSAGPAFSNPDRHTSEDSADPAVAGTARHTSEDSADPAVAGTARHTSEDSAAPAVAGTARHTSEDPADPAISGPDGSAFPGPAAAVVVVDLACVGAARTLWERLSERGIRPEVVVNNAGIFSFRDVLDTPQARIDRIVLLHDLTAVGLCRLAAADLLARGKEGYILNMASYSLWMPFPGLALYGASKAFLRQFSVCFAKEVRDRGIRVTALAPAGVATDLYGLTPRWQRIGLRLGVLISADCCARKGLRALWRGRRSVVPDWWNRLWIPLCKFLPMWALRPLRRFTMKYQK